MLMHEIEFSQIKISGHLVLTFSSLFNFLFLEKQIDVLWKGFLLKTIIISSNHGFEAEYYFEDLNLASSPVIIVPLLLWCEFGDARASEASVVEFASLIATTSTLWIHLTYCWSSSALLEMIWYSILKALKPSALFGTVSHCIGVLEKSRGESL